MFPEFPKERIVLPGEYQAIYTSHYKINREGKSFATRLSRGLETWLHKQVAADTYNLPEPFSTLEIGAGTLNQLGFEKKSEKYDIIEPFTDLFRDSKQYSLINTVYTDISEVPLQNKYDRITSVATLEHVLNLPELIAYSGLHLNQNGSFRASIPNEGSVIWLLAWKLTTGIEYWLKYHLNYSVLRKYEHVNTADEIERILRYFYKEVEKKTSFIIQPFSFYVFYDCRSPYLSSCEEYLQKISLPPG